MFIGKLFGLVFFLGLIFFVVWALRTLDKKQLKKYAIWFLAVGLVGSLLFSFVGHKKFYKNFDRTSICEEGDEDCLKSNRFHRFFGKNINTDTESDLDE